MPSGSSRLRESKGQMSTQYLQPEQISSVMTGLGHSVRRTLTARSPYVSRMASYGQARPQAPQSMQILGSMKYSAFLTPEMASTGQTISQAVHPTHLSVMKKDIRAPLLVAVPGRVRRSIPTP